MTVPRRDRPRRLDVGVRYGLIADERRCVWHGMVRLDLLEMCKFPVSRYATGTG